jgi:hypothetical protein
MKTIGFLCLLVFGSLTGCTQSVNIDQLFFFEIIKGQENNEYFLAVELTPSELPNGYENLTNVKLKGLPTNVSFQSKIQEYTDDHSPESWAQQEPLTLPLDLKVNETITFLFNSQDEAILSASSIKFFFEDKTYDFSLE